MENFSTYLKENLKDLGKLKIPADPHNSHRFKERGGNRKRMTQVPDKYLKKKTDILPTDVSAMVRGLDTTSRTIDIAKQASSGVWKLSRKEVIDIANKYQFIIPDESKPMKHLGSTGIQMVRYKPGIYYLFKPHKLRRKQKKRSPFGKGHSKIIKGIIGT
jgi:hypothetical protein